MNEKQNQIYYFIINYRESLGSYPPIEFITDSESLEQLVADGYIKLSEEHEIVKLFYIKRCETCSNEFPAFGNRKFCNGCSANIKQRKPNLVIQKEEFKDLSHLSRHNMNYEDYLKKAGMEKETVGHYGDCVRIKKGKLSKGNRWSNFDL